MIDSFVYDACQLAENVPARSQNERSAWACRGLAEVALMVWVSELDPHPLDQAIEKTNLINAPSRFATRLQCLRALFGNVPSYYPQGSDVLLEQSPVSKKVEGDTLLVTELADAIFAQPSKKVAHIELSALHGVGKKSFELRDKWRPSWSQNNMVQFLEFPKLDPSLLWRAWMMTPSGVTMVVPDERLDPIRMDVWWGVHNGIHLDHLSVNAGHGPSPIEFGGGLLIAEALAMSGEILAAIEAFVGGDYDVSCAIASALVERSGRLNLLDNERGGPSYERAVLDVSPEFFELPVLSEAYVSGPLDLIRAGHIDPLIPPSVTNSFERRWASAVDASSVAADFMAKVLSQ